MAYPCEKCFFHYSDAVGEEPICHGTDEKDCIHGTMTEEFHNYMTAMMVPEAIIENLWRLSNIDEIQKALEEIDAEG